MIPINPSENQTSIVCGFSAGQSTTVTRHMAKNIIIWLMGMPRWNSRNSSNSTSWSVDEIAGVDDWVK
jgi:hypothetical protein